MNQPSPASASPPDYWRVFLPLALLVGALLRLIWAADMEYKSDEAFMFRQVVDSGPWPWLGVASGVHIRNPGMSIWVFLALGKLFRVQDPVDLVRAVQLLNTAALALLVPFVHRFVEEREREPWLWAIALAAVNPFDVMYHRKIWAQSVLPFFCVLFLMAWWRRRGPRGAFGWGLAGACLGQIHMSGFFFAAGMVLWAALFDRARVSWRGWFAGSVLGSLTLLPWIHHVLTVSTGHPAVFGLGEAIQLKYWVFWLTDPLGLHLGNALGVHEGNSLVQQLADFARYPLAGGRATYLVGAAHLAVALLGAAILFRGARGLLRAWRERPAEGGWALLSGRGSETAFTQNAVLWGYGAVITGATVAIHRFYLLITFPIQFLWLARMALASRTRGAWLLALLWAAELFITVSFLGYVHVNGGAPRGDYGVSYRASLAGAGSDHR